MLFERVRCSTSYEHPREVAPFSFQNKSPTFHTGFAYFLTCICSHLLDFRTVSSGSAFPGGDTATHYRPDTESLQRAEGRSWPAAQQVDMIPRALVNHSQEDCFIHYTMNKYVSDTFQDASRRRRRVLHRVKRQVKLRCDVSATPGDAMPGLDQTTRLVKPWHRVARSSPDDAMPGLHLGTRCQGWTRGRDARVGLGDAMSRFE